MEEELVESIVKHQVDVLGITETKKKGKGMERISRRCWLFWSGVQSMFCTKFSKVHFGTTSIKYIDGWSK